MKSGRDESLGISMPTGMNNSFYFPRLDFRPGGRDGNITGSRQGLEDQEWAALPLEPNLIKERAGCLHFTRFLIPVAPPNPDMGRKVTCPRLDSVSSQALSDVEPWVVSLANF